MSARSKPARRYQRVAALLALALVAVVLGWASLPNEPASLAVSSAAQLAAPLLQTTPTPKLKQRPPGAASHRLSGLVVELEGGPIPFAQILCSDEDGETNEYVSDARGQFELASDSEEVELTVSAPGFIAEFVTVRLPKEGVRIELEQSLELLGQVVREDNGAPVPNALVETDLTQGPRDEEDVVRTDSEGRFRFEELAPGTYTLHARAAGLFGIAAPVTLAKGTVAEPILIRVRPAPSARLRVELDDHEPCAEGTVTLSSRVFGGFEAITDAQGLALFEGLPSSTYAVTVSCDEPELKSEEAPLELTEQDVDLVYVLRRGLTISGVVVDGDGQPVEDERVAGILVFEGEGSTPVFAGTSNEQGRFTLHGLVEGRYEVGILAGREPTLVDVAVGAEPTDVVVIVDAQRLYGRIVDEHGSGIAEANLHAEDVEGHNGLGFDTDEDGRFDVTHLSPGDFTIKATLFGNPLPLTREPAMIRLPLKQELILVARAPSAEINGSVRDARGPRAGVSVDLSNEESFVGSTQTDEAGRFKLRHVACEGGCTLTAEASSGETVTALGVRPGNVGSLMLRAAASLRGTVRDAPSSFSVSVQGGTFQVFHQTEGRFALHDLPAGKHVVSVQTDDRFAVAQVTLEPGESRSLELVLKLGSSDDADEAYDDLVFAASRDQSSH
jgi:hypothetical protein